MKTVDTYRERSTDPFGCWVHNQRIWSHDKRLSPSKDSAAVTARRGLWEAESAMEWLKLSSSKSPLLVPSLQPGPVISQYEADNFDEFSKIVWTVIVGSEEIRYWNERGGKKCGTGFCQANLRPFSVDAMSPQSIGISDQHRTDESKDYGQSRPTWYQCIMGYEVFAIYSVVSARLNDTIALYHSLGIVCMTSYSSFWASILQTQRVITWYEWRRDMTLWNTPSSSMLLLLFGTVYLEDTIGRDRRGESHFRDSDVASIWRPSWDEEDCRKSFMRRADSGVWFYRDLQSDTTMWCC